MINSGLGLVKVAVSRREPYIYSLKNKQWDGVFTNALDLICRRLNLRYKITNSPRRGLENVNLDGVLGSITNKTADIGVAALGMTSARLEKFDLIYSFFDRKYSVLINERKLIRPTGSASAVVSPLLILDENTWIIAISTMIVIAVLIALANRKLTKTSVFDVAFQMLGSTLNEIDIKSTSGAISPAAGLLTIIWLCWSIIIMGIFSSTLPAVFSVKPFTKLPFIDLKTFAESGFRLEGTSLSQSLLTDSSDPEAQILGLNMAVGNTRTEWVVNFHRMSSDEDVAVLVGHEVFSEIANFTRSVKCDRCDCEPQIIALEGVVKPPIAAFVFPYGSPYRELFQREYLQLLQFGLIQGLYLRGMRANAKIGSERCGPQKLINSRTVAFGTVAIQNIAFCLVIWLLGQAIAISVLIVELLIHQYRRHHNQLLFKRRRYQLK